MVRLKNRDVEACAYRHCTNEFRPRAWDGPPEMAQRFCSKRCRDAYRYDVQRAKKGVKKARKRHLGPTLPTSAEKAEKKITKTGHSGGGVTLVSRCGIEVPSTTDIKDDELRRIIRVEREWNSSGGWQNDCRKET